MTENKKALITGAAKGLGAHLARALKEAGYDVVIHYNTSADLAVKFAEEIGAWKTVRADLTQKKEVARMFSEIGPVSVLINTVGDFIYKPLLETTTEEFDYCIHNNLMSAWYCTKEALHHMLGAGTGSIINFGCVSADQLTSRPNTTPYYIAKTSLLMLTRSLAQELRDSGVRINMVSPGVLPTGHSAQNPDIPTVPFDAIARAVLFLIRSENEYIQGANLEVSSGWRPE